MLDYAEQRLLAVLSDEAIRGYYERNRSAEEGLREVRHKLLENLRQFKLKEDFSISQRIKKIISFYQRSDMLDELIFDITNGEKFPKRLGNVIHMKAIHDSHSKSSFANSKKAEEIFDVGVQHISEIFGILASKFEC